MVPILQPGHLAPAFRLKSHQSGGWLSLNEALERGKVLLVFYPGDFAPT